MPKGEDAIRRKKNKLNRKRLNRDDSVQVSNRIAAIIAAKKRRKSGKRSMCQGMCFSLPTLENPFNDKELKAEFLKKEQKKEKKKTRPSKTDQKKSSNSNGAVSKKRTAQDLANGDYLETKRARVKNQEIQQDIPLKSIENAHDQQDNAFENQDCPSKFLILCLNSIDNAMKSDGTLRSEEDRPLFVETWGVEFWKCYTSGKDVLETSGDFSTVEQIAWMTSTAADRIAVKEKEGVSFTSPFLLFIVSSQEKAAKVRSVCKPLKALGIHTVSLHSGASLEHQIHGLKSSEPEFLVSTPDRLLELVTLKAVDISGVSFLVIDELESPYKGSYFDDVKSIRQHILGDPSTVLFTSGLNVGAPLPLVQNLLSKSVCRLSLVNSIASESACIVQSVHMCDSEKKQSKGIELLDEACNSQLGTCPSKVLFVVAKDGHEEPVKAIKSKGYSISIEADSSISQLESSGKGPAVSVMDMEEAIEADLSDFELVIVSDLVLPIDNYLQILMGMARYSVNGKLHTLLSNKDDKLAAAPLLEILQQCGQQVPDALKKLCNSTAASL